MPDQKIDKAQAAVLVENAHDLWIRAKIFALAHEHHRLRKQRWFSQLAWATLIASIITVVLSAFGFSQEPRLVEESSSRTEVVTNSPGKSRKRTSTYRTRRGDNVT